MRAKITELPEPLLTTEEVAEWLQVPAETVAIWRKRNRGPKSIRVGKYRRYRREDVEAWLDQQTDDVSTPG